MNFELCRHCHKPRMNCDCEDDSGFSPPYQPPFSNGLTPAESERLAVLIEEAAEVQQIACKILRHGYESYNPDLIVNQGLNRPKLLNREMLEKEIGHLKSITHRMYHAGDISSELVKHYETHKDANGGRFMHHQPEEYQG